MKQNLTILLFFLRDFVDLFGQNLFLNLRTVQLSVCQMLNGESENVNYLVIEDGASKLVSAECVPAEFLRLEPRSSKTLYLSMSCPTNGNYTWEIYTQIQAEVAFL